MTDKQVPLIKGYKYSDLVQKEFDCRSPFLQESNDNIYKLSAKITKSYIIMLDVYFRLV